MTIWSQIQSNIQLKVAGAQALGIVTFWGDLVILRSQNWTPEKTEKKNIYIQNI